MSNYLITFEFPPTRAIWWEYIEANSNEDAIVNFYAKHDSDCKIREVKRIVEV